MIRLRSIFGMAFLAALAVILAFHAGLHVGYNQGWSDAHCGAGNQCEAGQN